MKKYDAIIIGNGQASTPLAKDFLEKGHQVALIEKKHYGGVCMNTGCTPTKTYVASAKKIFDAQRGDTYGFSIGSGLSVDLKRVKERKDKIVTGSRDNLRDFLFNNEGITVYDGHAKFVDKTTVEVNGEKLSAEKIFINVGTSANIPKEFEHIDYLTHEGILELEQVPEHLIIMGAGYIGLEFGQMFRRFGSEVTIIDTSSQVASKEDEDISQAIQSILEEEGINFRLNAESIKATQENGKISVQVSPDAFSKPVVGTHVLLAVGRVPNTKNLALDKAAVETDEQGNIKVDDYCATNVAGIWAMGDCNGEGAFTHTAYNDYEIVSDKLFGSGKLKISDRHTTYAMFIDPPLGRVGMNEKQAKEQIEKGNLKAKSASRPMKKVARALEMGETKGMMKIIVEEGTDKILGASILGVNGDEVVQAITHIMNGEGTIQSIKDTIQIHPTVQESLPTLLEELEELS